MTKRVEIFCGNKSIGRYDLCDLPRIGDFIDHDGEEHQISRVVFNLSGKAALHCEAPKSAPKPEPVAPPEPPKTAPEKSVDKPRRKS